MENKIFTDSNIPKAYLRLSLPLVFSMAVTLIYNLADTYFVARSNDTNIVAGVSLGMPLFTLLMAFGNIFDASMAGDHHGICGNYSFNDHRIPVHGKSYCVLSLIHQPSGSCLSGSSCGGILCGRVYGSGCVPGGCGSDNGSSCRGAVLERAAQRVLGSKSIQRYWLRSEFEKIQSISAIAVYYSARNPAANS